MGPLGMSAKQHREYLKLQSQEQREQAKMERDESRKNQLHEIKLQEAAAKANQGIGHKEDLHAVKLQELKSPLGKPPKINREKMGLPSINPMSGTGMFKQGQHKLYAQGTAMVPNGTDTVPAMLTPGEAVIPAPAAQNPKNKKAIQRMVQEGRQKNKLRDGTASVVNSDVPSLAYEHSDVPGSSFEDGTERVYDFNRGSAAQANYNDGTYGVIPQQVQQAAGYNWGTVGASQDDVPQWDANYTMNVELPQAGRGINVADLDNTSYGSDISRPKLKVNDNPETSSVIGNFFRSMGKSTNDFFNEDNARLNATIAKEKAAEANRLPGLFEQLTDAQRQQRIENHEAFINPSLKASNTPAVPTNIVVAAPTAYTQTGTTETGGTQSTYAPLASTPTVAERNNNPGNLVFANQAGAVKGDKRPDGTYWAIFETPEAGRKALEAQLALDTQKRGMPLLDTMKKYAPAADKNNPDAYAQTIANQLGIKVTDKVPADKIGLMADAITRVESGGKYKDPRILNKMTSVDPNAVPQMTALQEPSVEGTGFKVSDTGQVGFAEGDKGGLGFSPENATRFNMIGTESQALAPSVDAAFQKAMSLPEPEQKSFLEKAISSIYGDTGLFNTQELLRFAIVAAGGMMTGARSGRAIQFAARDVLKSSDSRHDQAFKADLANKQLLSQEKRADDRLQATIAGQMAVAGRQLQGQQAIEYRNNMSKVIDTGVKNGSIRPEIAQSLYSLLAKGQHTQVEEVLANGGIGTDKHLAKVPEDTKPVHILQEGFSTPIVAYPNPNGQGWITIEKDSKGNRSAYLLDPKSHREVTATTNLREDQLKAVENSLDNSLFAVDKNHKPIQGALAYGKGAVLGQIQTWSDNQRRLGLPDDPSRFKDSINTALATAAKFGDTKPRVDKLLDLALINTTTLSDPSKLLDNKGKMIDSGVIGKMTADVKQFAGGNNEKATIRASSNFLDKVAAGYQSGNTMTANEMADKVDPKYRSQIKDAPNNWWAYVYYQMAINKNK